MPRSVRLTLTLWYVGILAIILVVFGWVLYSSVTTGLTLDIDKTLRLQAETVAKTVETFQRAELAAGGGPGNWTMAPSPTFLGQVERGQLPELLGRWARRTDNLEIGYPVRLLDRTGEPLAASANFRLLEFPVTATVVAEALRGRTVYETARLAGSRVRLVTHPVLERDRILYMVQVAASLNQIDAAIRRFRLWLCWLIPAILAAASLVGWFLATTALKPVGVMVAKARRISARHLDERLDVPRTGDELEQLAVTFNQMLAGLEQAFRQLRQFSAAASHELRTPLTVMRGELELALRRPRDLEEYQRVLRVHLKAADRMTSIVEDLLLLAYSEAADREVEWNPVELRELIEEMRDEWQPIAQAKPVQLDLIPGPAQWVMGERRLLERLVANLLDNAIKHTPSGGHITLHVNQQNHLAALAVRDTGPGIPPDELPQIFERFFKPGPSSPAGPRSTGIGLGLCRWIAEAHRGYMDVTSLPGQGATFTVRMPLTAPPAYAPPPPPITES